LDVTVDIHVTHYNEGRIAPFVINYWKTLPLGTVYIWDNHSTDNSLDLICDALWDKVYIDYFDTNNQMSDVAQRYIKNTKWKLSRGKADFCIVSDFDECLYNETILEDLQIMKSEGYTLMRDTALFLSTPTFPEYSDTLLHMCPDTRCHFDHVYDKLMLIDPNKIDEVNWSEGSHQAWPTGTVKWYHNRAKLMHIVNLGPEYLKWKYRRNFNRQTLRDKRHNHGVQYRTSHTDIDKWFQNVSNLDTYWDIIKKIPETA